MSSGGGSSGEIGYPSYMEETHGNFLYHMDITHTDEPTYSIVDLLNTAHGALGNPYEGEESFDPNAALTLVADSPLKRVSDQFSASKTILDALDASTDWKAYIDDAYSKIDKFADIDFLDNLSTALSGLVSAVENIVDSATITNLVTAFETNKKTRFRKEVSMWSAGMADVNAVHTSSFIMGLSLWQKEFADQVDLYEKELKYNIYNNFITNGITSYLKANVLRVSSQDQMVNSGAEIMSRLNMMKSQFQQALTVTKAEIEKLNIIAMKEKTKEQMDLDINDALWEFETYMYGANMLGSIAGAAAGRKSPKVSDAQSALSGAMAGGSLGSSFGPIGTGIGMGVGAILGWAMN